MYGLYGHNNNAWVDSLRLSRKIRTGRELSANPFQVKRKVLESFAIIDGPACEAQTVGHKLHCPESRFPHLGSGFQVALPFQTSTSNISFSIFSVWYNAKFYARCYA